MDNKKDIISLVVPCFNEESSIPAFYYAVKKLAEDMKDQEFEIIFVDDGSIDKTLSVIKKYAKMDKSVKYISFSRNFGKEAAMIAGLKESNGDFCVTLDVDLQHPLELIKDMYKKITNDGYELCSAKRRKRKQKGIVSLCSSLFYKITNKISDVKLEHNITDYCMITRRVADVIISLPEKTRFTKGFYSWVGFQHEFVEYEDVERKTGESSWTFSKLLKYAIDGLFIFTYKPIYFVIIIGSIMVSLGLFGLFLMFAKWLFVKKISEILLVSLIMTLCSGVVTLSLGLVAIYIIYINKETQNRPLYIIKEKRYE